MRLVIPSENCLPLLSKNFSPMLRTSISGTSACSPSPRQPWKPYSGLFRTITSDFPAYNLIVFSPPITMLDQAQKERMARNRQQALCRLRSRQLLMHQTQSGSIPSYVQCETVNVPGFLNALHGGNGSIMPLRGNNTDRKCGAVLPQLSHADQAVVGTSIASDESNLTSSIQQFDYVVVIDFEATCDKDLNRIKPQEIIEFPAVLVDCRQLTIGDCFQTYVKPVHHPILSEFCTNLTGIKQEQVDNGVSLEQALYWHDRWLEDKGIKDKKFAILIWSDWDCKIMLESECKLKGLRKPQYFNRWINLKAVFQSTFNGRKCNLRKAVEASGLKWTGRAHCGLDDALNTARLALELIRRGTNLTITSSMDAEPIVTKIRRPEWPGVISDLSQANKLVKNAVDAINGSDIENSGGNMKNSETAVNHYIECYCGVRCKRRLVKKPGPTCGRFFFACGRWTMADGSRCNFFQWATSP